jgi:hypothetical protein
MDCPSQTAPQANTRPCAHGGVLDERDSADGMVGNQTASSVTDVTRGVTVELRHKVQIQNHHPRTQDCRPTSQPLLMHTHRGPTVGPETHTAISIEDVSGPTIQSRRAYIFHHHTHSHRLMSPSLMLVVLWLRR